MDWRLIREEMLDGPMAMALDEVAAETVAEGGPATVRLYRWFPSAVTLGYGNDADVVDWEYCEEWSIDVTRRPTGGGAIYHDTTGDVAYSIIAPAEEFSGDVSETYREFLAPVVAAFEEVGLTVEFAEEASEGLWDPLCYLLPLDPNHDLVGPDGRKIAGNAQYRTREAIVQHGSLTFDVNVDHHVGCFEHPPVTTEEFDGRVCGVEEFVGHDEVVETGLGAFGGYDVLRSRFVAELEEALAGWAGAEEGEWTDEEVARGKELVEEKYATDEWIREGNDPTN
jgi:lipoate-protein ligase A